MLSSSSSSSLSSLSLFLCSYSRLLQYSIVGSNNYKENDYKSMKFKGTLKEIVALYNVVLYISYILKDVVY